MADEKVISQDDIEKLLSQPAGSAAPAARSAAPPGAPPASPPEARAVEEPISKQGGETSNASLPDPPAGDGNMAEKDIEFLLNQAEKALESINSSAGNALPQGVSSFRLQEFGGAPASTETATLDLVRDVELNLKIELGRTHMYLEDVLKLRKGSVVPLDKLAGDPVDVYVNGRLIARGEVLVLNDNFCVRVAELITGANVFN
ncbi:MAG: flagellar motor switch protein FliN [Thermoguttaceae bacterium]|jgi:flagellar motor switch protein FliN/FliY